MKYGLLYYKDTDNIGDDIQTYAQKRFLPRIDYLIDRESLGMFIPNKKEMVSVIMNAWYMHNEIAWPPSPYINPLPISMHFSCNDRLKGGASYLDGLGREYLKSIAPIGCRDKETLKRLQKRKIDSYFSGCMTLTIKPFDGLNRKDYICLVDVDEDVFNKVNSVTKKKIFKITHDLVPSKNNKLDIDTRMQNVEKLLKKYQQASLVITSRLHVMLPCLALGTPVILVHPDYYERDRLDTFLKYVTHFSKSEFLDSNVKKYIESPNKNSNGYIKIANELEKKCNNFINEKPKLDLKSLPNISEYKKIVEYKNYYYKLYSDCRDSSLKNILETDKYFNLYKDSLIDIDKQKSEMQKSINTLSNKVTLLEEKYNHIIYSRPYKIYKKLRSSLKMFDLSELKSKISRPKNRFIINKAIISDNKITYKYVVEGTEQFKKFFWMGELFSVEYNEEIKNVPDSILFVPLVANVIPIAWLNDAEIVVPSLDLNFLNCIKEVKKGYERMLPNIKFNCKIIVNDVEENHYKGHKTAQCFSGGVDSFFTLISHKKEKSDLITLWGADVDFENTDGWKKVNDFIKEVGKETGLKNVVIRASVRRFIDNSELEKCYNKLLGGDWWLIMQHGIGLLGTFAPYAYMHKLKTIYIPSTFTKEDNFACASNPYVDNKIEFAGTKVIHDGFSYNRQQKIIGICNYVKKTKKPLKIRTCFRSLKGDNCCKCPKCYMTLFAILTQELDPNEFGFKFNNKIKKEMINNISDERFLTPIQKNLWKQIQDECILKKDKFKNNKSINWIYDMNFE